MYTTDIDLPMGSQLQMKTNTASNGWHFKTIQHIHLHMGDEDRLRAELKETKQQLKLAR